MPSKLYHEFHGYIAVFWPKATASPSFHQYWQVPTPLEKLLKHVTWSKVGWNSLSKHKFLRNPLRITLKDEDLSGFLIYIKK
jgi:hypothetical protein